MCVVLDVFNVVVYVLCGYVVCSLWVVIVDLDIGFEVGVELFDGEIGEVWL